MENKQTNQDKTKKQTSKQVVPSPSIRSFPFCFGIWNTVQPFIETLSDSGNGVSDNISDWNIVLKKYIFDTYPSYN